MAKFPLKYSKKLQIFHWFFKFSSLKKAKKNPKITFQFFLGLGVSQLIVELLKGIEDWRSVAITRGWNLSEFGKFPKYIFLCSRGWGFKSAVFIKIRRQGVGFGASIYPWARIVDIFIISACGCIPRFERTMNQSLCKTWSIMNFLTTLFLLKNSRLSSCVI